MKNYIHIHDNYYHHECIHIHDDTFEIENLENGMNMSQ